MLVTRYKLQTIILKALVLVMFVFVFIHIFTLVLSSVVFLLRLFDMYVYHKWNYEFDIIKINVAGDILHEWRADRVFLWRCKTTHR